MTVKLPLFSLPLYSLI